MLTSSRSQLRVRVCVHSPLALCGTDFSNECSVLTQFGIETMSFRLTSCAVAVLVGLSLAR